MSDHGHARDVLIAADLHQVDMALGDFDGRVAKSAQADTVSVSDGAAG